MSHTRILIHAVFGTKAREKSISLESKRELYNYIHGIMQQHNCQTIRINGMADHVHILFNLHPSVSLSDLMFNIKRSSSLWMKRNNDFIRFKGWAEGYYACSIGYESIEACRQYIINQENHHYNNEFISELEYLIKSVELRWYPDEWK